MSAVRAAVVELDVDDRTLKCVVGGARVPTDGTTKRFANANLEGEVRFAQRSDGAARCAIGVAARATAAGRAAACDRLWFGVEVSRSERKRYLAFSVLPDVSRGRRLQSNAAKISRNGARLSPRSGRTGGAGNPRGARLARGSYDPTQR